MPNDTGSAAAAGLPGSSPASVERLSDLELADRLDEMTFRLEGLWCAIRGAEYCADDERRGVIMLATDVIEKSRDLKADFDTERQLRIAETSN